MRVGIDRSVAPVAETVHLPADQARRNVSGLLVINPQDTRARSTGNDEEEKPCGEGASRA
jgi:hypothetical protein